MSGLTYVTTPAEVAESVHCVFDSAMTWNYEWQGDLAKLYARGKKQQWDATGRIDWSFELDPNNPLGLPDAIIGIYGSDLWNRLSDSERGNLRQHHQACQMSQFLHGEQAAMLCAAKIVQQASDLDTKLYAATQAVDEARHVEIFTRLLEDKVKLAYPLSPALRSLLTTVIEEPRWDMTFLGMQVLVEGLAVAAFQRYRDDASDPRVGAIFAYVIQDEARHVAFGRAALRGYYDQLNEAECKEREEFVIESLNLMATRLRLEEVWENAGLPKDECLQIQATSPSMAMFRKRMFSRIVPVIRECGLFSDRMRDALAKLGVLELASADAGALLEEDAQVAQRFESKT